MARCQELQEPLDQRERRRHRPGGYSRPGRPPRLCLGTQTRVGGWPCTPAPAHEPPAHIPSPCPLPIREGSPGAPGLVNGRTTAARPRLRCAPDLRRPRRCAAHGVTPQATCPTDPDARGLLHKTHTSHAESALSPSKPKHFRTAPRCGPQKCIRGLPRNTVPFTANTLPAGSSETPERPT